MLVRILQSVLGTPVAMAPAKALCSKGERWYLVCPRTVANLPNSKPRRIEDTLILSLSKRFCNLLDKQWWRTSIWNDRSVLREIITNAKWMIYLKKYVLLFNRYQNLWNKEPHLSGENIHNQPTFFEIPFIQTQ